MNNNNNIELRFITDLHVKPNDVEVDKESRTITGTAIVINSESELLGGEFVEVIKPQAVTQELINSSDIFMLYNHNNDNGVLARSKNGKGTLKIVIAADAIYYEFEAPKTALGDSLLESVRRGDLSSSSFAFRVASDGEKWERRSDGTYLRTITKIASLHDFSIVTTPAYEATSVNARSLDAFKEFEKTELEKQKQQEVINQYYAELRQKLDII